MALDDGSAVVRTPTDANATFVRTLVAPLLALVQPTPLSFPPLDRPSPHPPTTSALSAIHVNALECLNNVFLSLRGARLDALRADPASGKRVWDTVWQALGAVGTNVENSGQEQRWAMWEIGVGVLWGIGEVWKGLLASDEAHVKVLMELCNATTDESVKVKCIGTLECLAQYPESVDGNRVSETSPDTCICLQLKHDPRLPGHRNIPVIAPPTHSCDTDAARTAAPGRLGSGGYLL